jgi:hypothetical protein
MRVVDAEGEEHRLANWPEGGGGFDRLNHRGGLDHREEIDHREGLDHREEIDGVEVTGSEEPVRELVLPYRGERLRGDEVRRRVDAWIEAGVVEPSVAEAVDAVLANPDWLRLEGHTVAVLGAGAEMGPLPSLMRWGARVAAVDLHRPAIWQRVLTLARNGAGSLVVPVPAGKQDDPLDEVAGVDLLSEGPWPSTS